LINPLNEYNVFYHIISYHKFFVKNPLTLFWYKAANDNNNMCSGTRQQGDNPVTLAVQYVYVNKTLFPPRQILCRLSRNPQVILSYTGCWAKSMPKSECHIQINRKVK
jgi:hypothetical protein